MHFLCTRHVQYRAAIFVSILSLSPGFNLAWSSPILQLLRSQDSPIGVTLTLEQTTWISSITLLGILVSNFFLGQLQDLIGRKTLLILSAFPNAGLWLMICFATSFEELLFARFFTGLVIMVPGITSAIYIGEIAEPEIRGELGMLNLMMFEVGTVIITAVGSYASYKTTAIVAASVPLIFLLFSFWIPESPYYYLRKGNISEARSSLQKLRDKVDVDEEINNMQKCVEYEMKEKNSFKELLLVPQYRKAILIGLGIKTLQQMSGAIAIGSYMKEIFNQASSGLDSSQSAIICTVVSLPSIILGSYLVDKMGRKPLYYISLIGCALAMFCEFIYFLLQDNLHSNVANINWLPLLGIILFNIFRTLGVHTLPLIIVSEIFPTNIKAIGQNVVMIHNSFLGFLVSLSFPLLNKAWGIYSCFGIFMGCCLLGVCFVYIFIPETKGKSFGDIQNDIVKEVMTNKK